MPPPVSGGRVLLLQLMSHMQQKKWRMDPTHSSSNRSSAMCTRWFVFKQKQSAIIWIWNLNIGINRTFPYRCIPDTFPCLYVLLRKTKLTLFFVNHTSLRYRNMLDWPKPTELIQKNTCCLIIVHAVYLMSRASRRLSFMRSSYLKMFTTLKQRRRRSALQVYALDCWAPSLPHQRQVTFKGVHIFLSDSSLGELILFCMWGFASVNA